MTLREQGTDPEKTFKLDFNFSVNCTCDSFIWRNFSPPANAVGCGKVTVDVVLPEGFGTMKKEFDLYGIGLRSGAINIAATCAVAATMSVSFIAP